MNADVSAVAAMLRAIGKFNDAQVGAAVAALERGPVEEHVDAEVTPLLTPKKLCERLQISDTTLWRLKLPYVRVGRRKRYRWSDVRSCLEQNQEAEHEIR